MIDSDLLRQWEDMRLKLESLRHLLPSDKNPDSRLAYFDELLWANELEVALHTICNFLLEHESATVETRDIATIENLHRQMELDDDCVNQLRDKFELRH
jgi:hypothetical protein